jgi:hypothetical protein
MRKIKFLSVFVLLGLLFSTASVALAEPPPPLQEGDKDGPTLNGADPNYVPSEAELKFIAAKEVKAKQHMQLLLRTCKTITSDFQSELESHRA